MEFTEINKDYKPAGLDELAHGDMLWSFRTGLVIAFRRGTYYGRNSMKCMGACGGTNNVVSWDDAVAGAMEAANFLIIPYHKLGQKDLLEALTIAKLITARKVDRRVGEEVEDKLKRQPYENNSA